MEVEVEAEVAQAEMGTDAKLGDETKMHIAEAVAADVEAEVAEISEVAVPPPRRKTPRML